ncbi:MAG: alkaline phosphatase, partial [Maribacter sp.]
MNNWKKTSLLTAFILLALVVGVFYASNITLSIPSSAIEFSPGQAINEVKPAYSDEKPKNIIVFIADGMGFSHLSLAMLTQQSESTPSVWHGFDVKGWHDTRSIYGPLTDSEASATAIATGTSTSFGYIGLDPDGNSLKNIFEVASDQQYVTAIVTDSYIWDGTPAAFVAHTKT